MSEWKDIGKELKTERKKREFSYEEVAEETRIPTSKLRALEENDYTSFDSPAYAKSFLQQYSDFLEIDAENWLSIFETGNQLAPSTNHDFIDRQKLSSQGPDQKTRHEAGGSLRVNFLILLVTVAVIAGGVWAFTKLDKKLDTDSPKLESTK